MGHEWHDQNKLHSQQNHSIFKLICYHLLSLALAFYSLDRATNMALCVNNFVVTSNYTFSQCFIPFTKEDHVIWLKALVKKTLRKKYILDYGLSRVTVNVHSLNFVVILISYQHCLQSIQNHLRTIKMVYSTVHKIFRMLSTFRRITHNDSCLFITIPSDTHLSTPILTFPLQQGVLWSQIL